MWEARKKCLMSTQETTLVGHNAKLLRDSLTISYQILSYHFMHTQVYPVTVRDNVCERNKVKKQINRFIIVSDGFCEYLEIVNRMELC